MIHPKMKILPESRRSLIILECEASGQLWPPCLSVPTHDGTAGCDTAHV